MFRSRKIWGLMFAVALAGGCHAPPPPPPGPTTQVAMSATEKPTAAPTTQKSTAQATWDLPDTDKPATAKRGDEQVLEQATREYARTMEQFMARRAAAGAGSATQPANGAVPSSKARAESAADVPPHPPETASANAGAATTAAGALPGADSHAAHEQVASAGGTLSIPNPTITQTPPRPDLPFNKDSPAVNTPLIVAQPRPLPATDDMAQKLAKQVKDYPQDTAAQLDWQLLMLLQGQSVPQLQSLSTLNGEDREMLSAVLDGITNFRNALKADSNMLLSRKIRPMLELSDRLRTQAELSIPTVALCTDVKGFGVYEPLEPARFPADMKEHRVIVYCEVENFSSQLDDQKRWETKLSQDVVLYQESTGLEVWRDKTPAHPIVDYSRNRRHDFFIVKMVRLPAGLTIGHFLLKVTVTDQQVNRVAENAVAVQIVAEQ